MFQTTIAKSRVSGSYTRVISSRSKGIDPIILYPSNQRKGERGSLRLDRKLISWSNEIKKAVQE
jgi:hypothetical protein